MKLVFKNQIDDEPLFGCLSPHTILILSVDDILEHLLVHVKLRGTCLEQRLISILTLLYGESLAVLENQLEDP